MKLKIEAHLSGQEIVDLFIKQLNENQITPALENVKFIVVNKDGKEISVSPDKVYLAYNNSMN
jgi:hypothetical protein